MKRFLCYAVAIIIAFALISPFYLYTGVSQKGGNSESNPVVINAGQEISIRIFHLKGTSNYFTWDDGQKLAFDLKFIFSKITTKAPQEPGIHKLTIIKDTFFFKVPTTYYYFVE